ncbi:endonuclease I [Chryseobacterium sp. RP-3-3]|uniref:Endonuclease I n=1 Tax=Chryseobacterium antibioticum TaxID=2728847 RepID=A0A7Y0ANV2_9FLAO|nr:endonuclease [Chryseobacterium antibioticum]NML70781.1 endonuclease I [Chryseobacterium antibioticum]
MIKKLLFAFLCFSCIEAFAQIPLGYYDGTAGLTGYPLKTKLSQIITGGHLDKGYNLLWTAYGTTDRDDTYENDNTILDFYSENPSGTDPYTFQYSTGQCGSGGFQVEGDCYNREHLLPQSFFYSASPMKNDIHFIVPTDGWVNTMHSDLPYGEVFDPLKISLNGSKRGDNTFPGYSDKVFEPLDEFKGDIARMLLYFVTRYENQLPGFNSTAASPLDGSTDRGFKEWYLNMLLYWNSKDPVSQREINRNNASYTYQGNRNPFIDHPDFINQIWTSTLTVDTEAPSQVINIHTTNIATHSANIEWTASTDNVGVVGYTVYLNGVKHGVTTLNNYYFAGLTPNTTYNVKIIAEDAFRNKSVESGVFTFTTFDVTPGNPNVLHFSEYVEGSSFNKALEIANTTGAGVNLVDYTLKLQTNGAGAWTTGLPLSGILNNNSVYVIVNSNIAAPCTPSSTNLSTTSSVLNFNGNDPIGLFKGSELVDIIGVFNNTANFALDKTLRRNTTLGNINYVSSEWDIIAKDDCSNLGIINPMPTLMVNVSDLPKKDIRVAENPISNNEIKFIGSQLSAVNNAVVYDNMGRIVKKMINPFKHTNVIVLENTYKGVYFVLLDGVTYKVIIK